MTYYNDCQRNVSANIESKLAEFQTCLQRWQHRKLTLMMKVTVVETFALPQLIYPLTTLDNTPQTILDRINKMSFEFVWEGQPDKIKRAQIIQLYEKGSLKLTDIYSFNNAL